MLKPLSRVLRDRGTRTISRHLGGGVDVGVERQNRNHPDATLTGAVWATSRRVISSEGRPCTSGVQHTPIPRSERRRAPQRGVNALLHYIITISQVGVCYISSIAESAPLYRSVLVFFVGHLFTMMPVPTIGRSAKRIGNTSKVRSCGSEVCGCRGLCKQTHRRKISMSAGCPAPPPQVILLHVLCSIQVQKVIPGVVRTRCSKNARQVCIRPESLLVQPPGAELCTDDVAMQFSRPQRIFGSFRS